MGASATLKKFAKSRETAYLQYGRLTGDRAKAITRIYKEADFCSQKSEQVQLNAVRKVESEIRTILPDENSRYLKLRTQVLDLLDQLNTSDHGQVLSQQSNHTNERSDQTTAGACGTQLILI